MNKLTQEQIDFLLDQYDVTEETISTIEKIFEDLNIEDFQYFILVAEVVSEYQSFKLNKELNSNLATPFHNLKDIIIKVLNFKLRGVTTESSRYENEVKSLVLKLTNE